MSQNMLQYGSSWRSKQAPFHEITVYMAYHYYGISKYFCTSKETGRSKLLSGQFVRDNYEIAPDGAKEKK